MEKSSQATFKPVSFTDVTINDSFWKNKLTINRKQTIPYQYEQCKVTGRIDAFSLDWEPGMEPKPHVFWDSDVAKWIEAASYSLATHPDPALDDLLDEVIELIVSAQQPDGYLNVYFTIVEPEKRWTDLRDAHELYCAGHLIEAGVAHYQATNKRTLFDAICRYADYIDTVFGPEENKLKGYPGHQELELALVKLYRVTKNEKYLKLSQFFIEERGKQPHYFDQEQEKAKGIFDPFMSSLPDANAYNQSHVPVREQSRVVGHAVRALYMYAAMADLAGELGDESLLESCERLWKNLHLKNMYITGGIGSTRENEGFTHDYDLPNETAYAETCASIAVIFWNHRLLQIDCDGKYADEIERVLYNGVLGGISLDGKKFFYDNPLSSLGNVHRQEWFGCACCPPNIARLLASLGEYIYSQSEDEIVTHLYIQGSGNFNVKGQEVVLHQQTNYPWEGQNKLEVNLSEPQTFGLKLRIPGWCREATLEINGEQINIENQLDKGYVTITRKWSDADTIILNFPMPVERYYAHPNIKQNVNRVALQRGPILYCVESTDNIEKLELLALPKDIAFQATYDDRLLDGVVKIEGEALVIEDDSWGESLYEPNKPAMKQTAFTAVPYYAWDNREPGQMRVWIPEEC